MAAVETTRPAPYGAITTYRAVNGLSNVFGVLSAWNDARVTRNALSKLSAEQPRSVTENCPELITGLLLVNKNSRKQRTTTRGMRRITANHLHPLKE